MTAGRSGEPPRTATGQPGTKKPAAKKPAAKKRAAKKRAAKKPAAKKPAAKKPAAKKNGRTPGGAMGTWLARYVRQTSAAGTALLFAVPLLAFYGVGLLFIDGTKLNGADFVTGFLFGNLGYLGYLWFQLGVVVLAGATAAVLSRRHAFDIRHFPFLVGECAIYAVGTGAVVLFVMREAHLLGPTPQGQAFLEALVLSAGAGFYEELVFRLGLLGGLWFLLVRGFSLPRCAGGVIAAVVTSVVFSLAHYVGPEAFEWYTFWYRLFAGLFFAAVFVVRGFAAAAWTHALYDVYVLAL